jgi:hypothetical protein
MFTQPGEGSALVHDWPGHRVLSRLMPHTVAFMEPRKPDAISQVAAELDLTSSAGKETSP